MTQVNCSFVWMEVCMKLASAALVSAPWVLFLYRLYTLSLESRGMFMNMK